MRKPSPSPRLRLEDLPTRELIARGEALLATQDYKDAVDVYKLLLKREPQAGWRDPLANAYLERAKQLASKGMYREAAVLWENIPSLCGQTPQPDLYVDWLLQTGQYAKATRAYAHHAAALSSAGELETRLAALALAGQKDVLQALPQDAPLHRQLSAVQAALRAYGQGEPEAAVRECLQSIPIRSPYRDLRQALFALLKLETDPASASAMVERISTTSPYHDLAEIIRACAAHEPVRALLALNPAQRELAVSLLGLDSRQIKLLKEWTRLGEHPNDKALFDFMTNNLAVLDLEQARQACLALLAVYPKGQPTYTRLFGPLPTLEAHRLQALQAEREHDGPRALRHWQACVDELAKDGKDPDRRLMAALVLRQIAELVKHKSWNDTSEAREYLEKSLQFDPDDRDAYLKLAELYKEADEDKAYHQWVERAVKQFPDDPQVLMAAVATATARKAYKKAAGFAERVLELDPINSKARAVLINSHLAHARKQMIAGKQALAEKELDSASQLERDKARSGVVEINRGLLAFRQHQRESMQNWLREGVRLAGGPLLGWLRLAVEASRIKLEPTTFQRDLGLGDPRTFTASRADLLTLTQWVNAYQEEGVESISSVLEDLEKPLKRAIKELKKEEDLLSVCECLHQAPHYKLLEYAATGALQHHPERPIFIYYQIYGRAEGDSDHLDDRDFDRLEGAMEAAKEAEDNRTLLRILRFINQNRSPFPFPRPRGGPPSLPFPRPRGGPPSLPMPPKMRREMEQLREELEQMPPVARERMLNEILDSLPIDDELPPEVQRAIMKALLLGGDAIEDLLDLDEDDFPRPSRGRGRTRSGRR